MSADIAIDVVRELGTFSAHELRDDAGARKRALVLSRQLSMELQEPADAAVQMVFSPYVAVAVRIAVDLKLFERIHARGSTNTPELASDTQAEPLLITRILRLLAGMGFVRELAEEQWAATPVTEAMASAPIAAGHRFVWDVLITSACMAPRFLRETGQRCPSEPTDGFIQYAQQTKHPVFDYLTTKPELLKDFNMFMGNTMGAKRYWVDWYPVEEQLFKGRVEGPFLIDIGGGRGHDLQAFHEKYPAQGKLILQDLPQALDGIGENQLDPSIDRMVYDFFTEQPIQGARAYFLHHILHDWSEGYCLKILANIRAAMTPGYSKLLIHDLILPDVGATAYQTIWDMTMMTFNGGIERSRRQWAELLEKAGFEVVKLWVDNPDADGIVEAIVPSQPLENRVA